MPAIGITGGIAMGKSAFCDCLRELLPAATFFNADTAARELAKEDAEVKAEIAREFGSAIYSSLGDLNREALGTIVFGSAERRSALEKILHPRIRRRWSAQARGHRNSPNFFFADIPLLYETSGETLCDRVVVVACAPDIQRERLRKRLEHSRSSPGRAAEELLQRMIESQMPLNEKIARADHVVWNDNGPEVLQEQAKRLTEFWQTETWTKNQ
jgi:dephospho-CoA kinase